MYIDNIGMAGCVVIRKGMTMMKGRGFHPQSGRTRGYSGSIHSRKRGNGNYLPAGRGRGRSNLRHRWLNDAQTGTNRRRPSARARQDHGSKAAAFPHLKFSLFKGTMKKMPSARRPNRSCHSRLLGDLLLILTQSWKKKEERTPYRNRLR